MQIHPDDKEYHRVKYSLKMALRMINGSFDEFKVHVSGNSGGVPEEELDKTTIECFYKAKHGEDSKLPQDLSLFNDNSGNGDFADVTTGSIPAEIKLKEPIVFFVFRVIVGRSFVMKRSALEQY